MTMDATSKCWRKAAANLNYISAMEGQFQINKNWDLHQFKGIMVLWATQNQTSPQNHKVHQPTEHL